MSGLFENHIVGFPTGWLKYASSSETCLKDVDVILYSKQTVRKYPTWTKNKKTNFVIIKSLKNRMFRINLASTDLFLLFLFVLFFNTR